MTIQAHATLVADAEALLPAMIDLRRAIHADPELGLQTPRTSAKARAALAGLPLDFRSGPATSGFVATLTGAREGRTVLLRGDMDALPMHEETGLDFASGVAGAMHACGHDSHVAMLAGAARLLCARREQLAGSVVFMFQPGEEGFHGARHMIEDGLLDPLPDAAFALHVMPNAPHGVFTGRAGPTLASTDTLRVTVTGRGGHGAMPHETIDPVPVACAIVQAIQTFIARRVSVFTPAVITIGRIAAGSTDNVIPDTAEMLGTIRALSPETRAFVHAELATLIDFTARAHGATATMWIGDGFPVTVCDGRMIALARSVVGDLFGADGWIDLANPIMGGEDFSYVLEQVPGAMIFLGASQAGSDGVGCCGLHSARMMLDEAVMARGAAVHAAVAETFLRDGFMA